jgi:hypothetical protein
MHQTTRDYIGAHSFIILVSNITIIHARKKSQHAIWDLIGLYCSRTTVIHHVSSTSTAHCWISRRSDKGNSCNSLLRFSHIIFSSQSVVRFFKCPFPFPCWSLTMLIHPFRCRASYRRAWAQHQLLSESLRLHDVRNFFDLINLASDFSAINPISSSNLCYFV